MTDKHKELVKQHFEATAQRWDDIYSRVEKVNDLVQGQRKDYAIAFLKDVAAPGSKVLDVGCGAGIVSIEAARMGFLVTGIDIAEQMINHCRSNLEKSDVEKSKCRFVCGDVFDIKFDDGAFTAILALGFLEYQKNESRMLHELNRILEPDGILIISGPQKYTIANCFRLGYVVKSVYLTVKKMIGKKVVEGEETSINEYSLRRFKTLLEPAGYKAVDYKRHGYANFMFLRELIGFKGELLLYRFFTGLSKIFPVNLFANNIIVVAKKK